MEVGLIGTHMVLVVLRAALDEDTERENAHHPNHREMAHIVVEAHP